MICFLCKKDIEIKSNKYVEPMCLDCEELLNSMDRKRDEFMKEYKLQHKYCPICGDTDGVSTLAGFAYNSENPESFKDLNDFTCRTCRNTHTVHERVSTFKP